MFSQIYTSMFFIGDKLEPFDDDNNNDNEKTSKPFSYITAAF